METILVVDDEASNISILRESLKDDYRILAARSGQNALKIIDKDLPDLVLLDVLMPEMDGYELCSILKRRDDTRMIPILFVSGQDRVEDKTRGFEAGGLDYITKPFEIPEVRARVKTHIEFRKAQKFQEEMERITRHDLKAPLQAMLALPDLMLYEENLTEDQRENLELIKESAVKMLRMINLGLDLFKMEMGLYTLQKNDVDIRRLLGGIISERRRQFGDVVPLMLECDQTRLYTASGEELLLYSLFSNLIQNAWEATPLGEEIRVGLSIDLDGTKTEMVRIDIRNAGEVPVSIRDSFFSKYVTAGKEGGTGLGTYSASMIARVHEGSIYLDTGETGFTTLSVYLPLKK